MIIIHAEAAKRANELATNLVDAMTTPVEPTSAERSSYEPDVPPALRIKSSDFRGPMQSQQSDRFGRPSARFIADNESVLALEGNSFSDFLKAVGALYRQPAITAIVSETTLSDVLFEWLYETKRGRISSSMTEYVLAKVERLVQDLTIIVPLFGLHVERSFRFGNVDFADLSAREMQDWRETTMQLSPESAEPSTIIHDRLKKKYQGRAAARFKIRAEKEFGISKALQEADLSVAALRLYSVGAFMPERPTGFCLFGREFVPSTAWILQGSIDTMLFGEHIMHADDIEPLVLDAQMITEELPRLIGHWSVLIQKSERSPFEAAALRSMLLYSRATKYRNISEKLIHIFAAIESLLLRNETEPIAASLADRLAFIVGTDATRRLAVARNVRDVYAMRSRFVHHAIEEPPDGKALDALESFLVTVSQMFMNLGGAMQRHPTRDSYLDELELRKYE